MICYKLFSDPTTREFEAKLLLYYEYQIDTDTLQFQNILFNYIKVMVFSNCE